MRTIRLVVAAFVAVVFLVSVVHPVNAENKFLEKIKDFVGSIKEKLTSSKKTADADVQTPEEPAVEIKTEEEPAVEESAATAESEKEEETTAEESIGESTEGSGETEEL